MLINWTVFTAKYYEWWIPNLFINVMNLSIQQSVYQSILSAFTILVYMPCILVVQHIFWYIICSDKTCVEVPKKLYSGTPSILVPVFQWTPYSSISCFQVHLVIWYPVFWYPVFWYPVFWYPVFWYTLFSGTLCFLVHSVFWYTLFLVVKSILWYTRYFSPPCSLIRTTCVLVHLLFWYTLYFGTNLYSGRPCFWYTLYSGTPCFLVHLVFYSVSQ